MKIDIEVDQSSGFCFGVIRAINKAQEELVQHSIYSLGEIVHNGPEMQRLETLGLKTLYYAEFEKLKNSRILFRAHGEPPKSYDIARKNGNQIIDATCPVVLQLQKRIRQTYVQINTNQIPAQIVILGKVGHAEVIGLQGQTNNTAIVVQSEQDLDKIDYNRRIYLFAQTTASIELFRQIVNAIKKRIIDENNFEWHNTICKNVTDRSKQLRDFVQKKDLIIFIGGHNSSNAKYLFAECKQYNNSSFFFSDTTDDTLERVGDILNRMNLREVHIGICGATSTPLWVLEEAKEKILHKFS